MHFAHRFAVAIVSIIAITAPLALGQTGSPSRAASVSIAEQPGSPRLLPVSERRTVGETEADGYGVRNTDLAGGLGLFFPRAADGSYVVEAGTIAVTVRVAGAAAVDAQVSAGKVAYRNVYPGVDSIHRLHEGRSEEFLVLRDKNAPTRFDYELLAGPDVKIESDNGGVRFTAPSGETLLIEEPYVLDRTGTRHSSAARYELGPELDGGLRYLALIVDPVGLEYPLAVDPTWTRVAAMSVARREHRAVLLSSGKIFVAGGESPTTTYSSAEIYSPSTNTWTPAPAMSVPRRYFTMTKLADGRVLVAGGKPGAFNTTHNSAEVYNPTTNSWMATGSMVGGRAYHTAVLLADGRVLVSGGIIGNTGLASAEIYNPLTNAWTATGSMAHARNLHTLTLLPSGQVLVVGSYNSGTQPNYGEVYNPTTGQWSLTANAQATERTLPAAILLANGRVLICGGDDGVQGTRSTEIYNPATNTFAAAASMNTRRVGHGAVLLTNAAWSTPRVYVVGGAYSTAVNELYDPVANTWTSKDPMTITRGSHATIKLDGSNTIYAIGGDPLTGPNDALKTVEKRE